MTDLVNGSPPSSPPNTKQQIAAHEANEKRAAEEATWPIFQVRLVGDETEWVPRPNPIYWDEVTDPETGVTSWVPKAADELPEHASLSENGQVQMQAVCVVTCHAKNEDHAKAIAMQANPGYHTVDEVTGVDA